MISVNHVSMHYGSRWLFDDAHFSLIPGNRYALVGANGTGKSTFLRLLAQQETPSLGELFIAKKATLSFLKQDQFRYEADRVLDVVLQGRPRLWKALSEKEEYLSRSFLDAESGLQLALLEEIIFEEQGYTAHTFAQSLLVGLGIESAQHLKPLSTLSGGFKLRVLLAQTLFEQPDILLLDEPTNHLDIVSIAWLEEYLKNTFKGLLVFISHDQDFLNGLCSHVLDIDYGEIREYPGNYTHFLVEKKLKVEQKLQELQYIEQKIAHMQAFVDRFKAGTRSKQAQSRAKMIDRLELPDVKHSSRRSPVLHFKIKRPSAKKVLEVHNITKRFGEKTVLEKISFSIHKGEKVAIMGHNGIGKSTLLKILMGQHQADAGAYEWPQQSQVGYFAQDHHEKLQSHARTSVLAWLNAQQESNATHGQIRQSLANLLFSGDEVDKAVSALSGGEMARLLLADLSLQQANVLVLDEPTNHLDLESREALAEALKTFEGTVLFVSHDRHFVSTIANRILAFTDKGLSDFQGPYQAYLDRFGADYLNRMWLLAHDQ